MRDVGTFNRCAILGSDSIANVLLNSEEAHAGILSVPWHPDCGVLNRKQVCVKRAKHQQVTCQDFSSPCGQEREAPDNKGDAWSMQKKIMVGYNETDIANY